VPCSYTQAKNFPISIVIITKLAVWQNQSTSATAEYVIKNSIMWCMYGGSSAYVTYNVKWFLDTNYLDWGTVYNGLTLWPLITWAHSCQPYGGTSLLEKQQYAAWAVAFDWSSYNNYTKYTWKFLVCQEFLVLQGSFMHLYKGVIFSVTYVNVLSP
jgi:hypothetical protein